jgi:hypothetical protein
VKKLVDHVLRAAALVVTDRRWTAPLSAMALGFGLFVGVAIGPSAAGTLAGVSPIVQLPSVDRGMGEGSGNGTGAGAAPFVEAPEPGGGGGGGLGALPEPAPLATTPSEPAPPPAEATPPAAKPPPEAPEAEGSVELKGVVVHANRAARSYAMAIDGGELVSVHAAKLPPPGSKLGLLARPLANNTFAEAEPRDLEGKAKRATFRGAVTFLDADPADPTYTVSGRGASILVHVRPDPAGATPQLPALGSYATVTVDVDLAPATGSPAETPQPPPSPTVPPLTCTPDLTLPSLKPAAAPARLWQRRIEVEGEPSTYVDLAGIVTAVCPDQGRLTISADGAREGERDLELIVPTAIATDGLLIADSIVATAMIGEDGSLTLAGLAGDEGVNGADDGSSAQGDLKR